MAISRIGDLLEHSLNRHGAHRGVVAAQVVDAVNVVLVEMFGPDIKQHVVAHAYTQGEVRLIFTNSMAAAEIRNHSEKILSTIQKKLPKNKFIRLRLIPAVDQL